MTNLKEGRRHLGGGVLKTYSVLLLFLALKAGGNSSMAWGMKQVPERLSLNAAAYLRDSTQAVIAVATAGTNTGTAMPSPRTG